MTATTTAPTTTVPPTPPSSTTLTTLTTMTATTATRPTTTATRPTTTTRVAALSRVISIASVCASRRVDTNTRLGRKTDRATRIIAIANRDASDGGGSESDDFGGGSEARTRGLKLGTARPARSGPSRFRRGRVLPQSARSTMRRSGDCGARGEACCAQGDRSKRRRAHRRCGRGHGARRGAPPPPPLSPQEVIALEHALDALSPERKAEALQLIRGAGTHEHGAGEFIDVDLDELPTATLRVLERFACGAGATSDGHGARRRRRRRRRGREQGRRRRRHDGADDGADDEDQSNDEGDVVGVDDEDESNEEGDADKWHDRERTPRLPSLEGLRFRSHHQVGARYRRR